MTPEFWTMIGVACSDSGLLLGDDLDSRVVALIEKHKPQ